MRRAPFTAVVLLSLSVLAVCVASATAKAATTCNASTPLIGTINGDVSAGPGCDLSAVTLVKGDVDVNPGGSLRIAFGSSITITGSVKSKKATSIDIEAGSIGGDVQIEGTTAAGPNEQTFLGYGTVKGNVDIHQSTAYVKVVSETVGRDVRVHDNTGSNSDGDGIVQVSQSTVHGNVDVGKNSLTGFDTNFVSIFNGPQANGSIDGDLHVHDNSVTGGSFNQVQTYFNGVGGNVDVDKNTARGSGDNEVQTYQNSVNGGLDVDNNTAAGGSTNVVDVSGNTVRKELDCRHNVPHATGGANTAGKKKKGECASL